MIDLSSAVRDPDHWVRLNVGFRSDLRWWELFLDEWNETSLCGGVVPVSPFEMPQAVGGAVRLRGQVTGFNTSGPASGTWCISQ